MKFRFLAIAALSTVIASSASAAPFNLIRIGDVDGFGWSNVGGGTAGLLRSGNSAPADTNGNGILEQTEFLPNTAGSTAVNTSDVWDNRQANEIADTGPLGGTGYTDNGSTGFSFTDRSLLAIEPSFVFDFSVATGDINPATTQIFFNLVFGDYDVVPASIALFFTPGATTADQTLALTTQPGTQDGLIQAATATLDFADVFSTATGGFDGYLRVDFLSPNEPYTAFDYVELSLQEISFEPVPEPAIVAIFGMALAGLGYVRRRRG